MTPIPDPVLGILAAMGLLTYAGLGCVTGAITARVNGWRYRDGKWTIYKKDEEGDGGLLAGRDRSACADARRARYLRRRT